MNHFNYSSVERKKLQNPPEILKKIGLQPGQKLLDIGCGDGFFTIPASKIVGPEGKIYGIDIDSDAICRLKLKISKEGLKNIELKIGPAETTIFPNVQADFAFFSIDLHDFKEVTKVLTNARRMLKDGGTLIDIDWKKEAMEFGPSMEKKFDINKAKLIIRTAGFKFEKVEELGPFFYMITAKK
jgi:ubiquinone/menaquinone biosynthesis C-methylase UbiE